MDSTDMLIRVWQSRHLPIADQERMHRRAWYVYYREQGATPRRARWNLKRETLRSWWQVRAHIWTRGRAYAYLGPLIVREWRRMRQ